MNLTMIRLLAFPLAYLAVLPWAPAASAWSDTGHQVVATVAWERLSPEAREAAVELLRAAPPDSGIAELAPPGRDRLLFTRAASWADLIKRLDDHPYDRRHWHYTNFFWRRGPDGEPRPVPGLAPREENAVERLRHLSAVLADRGRPAAERAVALAWLLHLVGDVHQPLHTSSRVTGHPGEEEGDRGGNAVLLHREGWFSDRRVNLHSYWDRIFDTARGQRFWESEGAWVDRLAEEAVAVGPPGRVAKEVAVEEPGMWARESLGIAQSVVYPGVVRGEEPSRAYEERALATSRRAVALAGYRLARLVEGAVGNQGGG